LMLPLNLLPRFDFESVFVAATVVREFCGRFSVGGFRLPSN
jgi:hypothetical protein